MQDADGVMVESTGLLNPEEGSTVPGAESSDATMEQAAAAAAASGNSKFQDRI